MPAILLLMALAAAGCNLGAGLDAGVVPRDDGGEGGEPASDTGGGDGGLEAYEGPLTFVISRAEPTTERLCDLDVDGDLDNAIADLGNPGSAIFSALLETVLAEAIDGGERVLAHFPWVELGPDRSESPLSLICLSAEDDDGEQTAASREDDFSGEETFFADALSVDHCGEPLYSSSSGELRGRDFTIHVDGFPVSFGGDPFVLRGAELTGSLELQSGLVQIAACASAPIRDLGLLDSEALRNSIFGDVTLLEIFLSGGASAGTGSIPGVTPDVDLDGDGLERIVVDSNAHVERCVDGDGTTIEGRDCWMDARIADAFSMNFIFEGVTARLAGPLPSVRPGGEVACDEGGSSSRGWGPCPDPEPECERWETAACDSTCGPGSRRCSWDCRSWGPCIPDEDVVVSVAACSDVELGGDATCEGDPPAIQLIDGPGQHGGVLLSQPITVGTGPLVATATVQVERGESEVPGFGWALVLYRADGDEWFGPVDESSETGVSGSATGYGVEWRFNKLNDLGDESDQVQLSGVGVDEGTGVNARVDWISGFEDPPNLDSNSEGALEQGVRLAVQPDLPGTAEDETAMRVDLLGSSGLPLSEIRCGRVPCPLTIVAGEVFRVGVVARAQVAPPADENRDAVVELRGPGSLTVESRGVCP